MWLRKQADPSLMPWQTRMRKAVPGGGVLPDSYRPASSPDVPEGRSCGNCKFFEDGFCALWQTGCDADWYCDAWEPVGVAL
jgi:hypothetical protein